MSKGKGKAPQTQPSGLFKPESIKDVADSLNITNLPEAIASALASDVEYRIHQVVDEAARFTRHARRTMMSTSDVDQALRVLNIEPLYGHSPYNPPTFKRALPFPMATTAGTVYYVEDEEIDFDKVLKEEKIPLPKPANWSAHWLAVEGVQPLIPENPPAIPREETDPATGKTTALKRTGSHLPTPSSPPGRGGSFGSKNANQLLVKQVLSRELQLYYTRLTSTLLPPRDDAMRAAALTSLRNDAGLQTLSPYLVKWVGDGVIGVLRESSTTTELDGKVLDVLLEVIGALLDNKTLFVEPYLHQLLPPLLSILLFGALHPSNATHLRTTASAILSHLLNQHSTTYPSLPPRIMKTLLVALISPGKSKGTREGAVRGLVAVGKEAVRKGLIEGGGAKLIASECSIGETSPVVSAVLDAFRLLSRPSPQPRSLNPQIPRDLAIMQGLSNAFGPFFAAKVCPDGEWAESLLAIQNSGSL